jgi:hypothetical protein
MLRVRNWPYFPNREEAFAVVHVNLPADVFVGTVDQVDGRCSFLEGPIRLGSRPLGFVTVGDVLANVTLQEFRFDERRNHRTCAARHAS